MKLPSEIIHELNSLFKPTIEYFPEFNQYKLNDIWINEIDDSYFESYWTKIKFAFLKQFKNGITEKQFLTDLIEEINLIAEENNFIDKFDIAQIDNRVPKIIVNSSTYETPPSEDKLTFDYFFKIQDEEMSDFDVIDQEYYDFLYVFYKIRNGLKDESSFYKLRLLYVLGLLRDTFKEAQSFLNIIEYNHKNHGINLSALYDAYSEEAGTKNKVRCNISYNKKETANLITFLIEENIFSVGNDASKSKMLTERFVEENFNYKFGKSEYKAITEINKETSDIRNPKNKDDREKHIKFLQSLKEKIDSRIETYSEKK
jgi:hypothetical protein